MSEKYCKCGLLLITDKEKILGRCRFCMSISERLLSELDIYNRRIERRYYHYAGALWVSGLAFLYWFFFN